uniref:Uncharacterized protein n=1 Tax=Arundo donax TaxID=35708 RepID=A0A0A9F9M4_ARUDO
MQCIVVSNWDTDVKELALSSDSAEYKIQRLKMNTEFSCL